jgi:solute carrier family 25 folate transporter 32
LPFLIYCLADSISRTRVVGSSTRLLRHIYTREGGIAAFYRGLTPNIIGNSTSWAAYFLFYGNIKQALSRRGGDSKELGASEYFLASGAAGISSSSFPLYFRQRLIKTNDVGILTALLTNPIWVLKTRMLSTGSAAPGAYTSFIAGARQILTHEGFAGFYRGLVPALFGVSHGAFQFMAYEKLKAYRTSTTTATSTSTTAAGANNSRNRLGTLDLLGISGLSKVFAGCITYPYQVLRTRLQSYNAAIVYRGVWDVTQQIWRQEGITGFYKGLGPNLLRVLPGTWVTFLVYENTKGVLYKSVG